MCGIMMEAEHSSKNDYKHQMKHILSENMRMIPDDPRGSKEIDKYGIGLHVDEDDDDKLHIKEHSAFRKANSLRPQYESWMKQHEKKHAIQLKEKERLKIKKETKKEY